MVFHNADVFRGHTLALTFFFWHFLPVFVLISTVTLKIVLNFAFYLPDANERLTHSTAAATASAATAAGTGPAPAFELASFLTAPSVAAASTGLFDHGSTLSLVLHWLVLLLLCCGALITNTVLIRFLFDSLPFLGALQPKLRKNMKIVLEVAQTYGGWLPERLPRFIRTKLNFFGSLWFGVPLAGSIYLYFVSWDCDSCWHTKTESWSDTHRRIFADAGADGASELGVCSASQLFTCNVLSKASLILALVFWQWLVIAVSIRARPRRTAASDDMAFGEWHDMLYNDENWQRVVADAAYAELLMASLYFLVLAMQSPNGIGDGMTTFLIVCSGQSTVYACVWFSLHQFIDFTHAARFVSRWVATGDVSVTPRATTAAATTDNSPVADVPVSSDSPAPPLPPPAGWTRRWARTSLIVHTLAGCVAVISWVLSEYGIATGWLVGYCMCCVFPAVTHQCRTDLAWLADVADRALKAGHNHHSGDFGVEWNLSPASAGSGSDSDFTPVSRTPPIPVRVLPASSSSDETPRSTVRVSPPPMPDFSCHRRHRHCCTAFRRGVVRYRIYLLFSSLFSIFLAVIVLATLQRQFVLRPAELPHNFYCQPATATGATTAAAQAVSIDMIVSGRILSSGRVEITPRNASSSPPLPQTESELGGYSFCTQSYAGLSLLDYTLFAQLPYFVPNSTDFQLFLRTFFPDFELRAPPPPPPAPPVDANAAAPAPGILRRQRRQRTASTRLAFHELYSSARNLSVIALRGTNAYDFMDWVIDLDLWFEVGTYQVFSKLLPGLGLWSTGMRTNVFRFLSVFVEAVMPSLHGAALYSDPVVAYVQTITDRRVVITGHSLGGGLAQIVGARTGRIGVSLSGPGIVEARGKLNLSREAIDRSVVNIVPSHDLVASIGTLGGTVHNVGCQHRRPDICHVPMATVCELIEKCGPRPADARLTCDFTAHSLMNSPRVGGSAASSGPDLSEWFSLNAWLRTFTGGW